MPLAAGVRLGPYEISSPIGAGGMGEVYRATDTSLKRSVALKVLPDAVSGDADRLARFQREAQLLAALDHPNIAAIHGLESSSATTALVMELVEGPTLAELIARGPIPVDEALAIATQIAAALEAAHARGIVHRDLKPANVKVRDDGTVKVLDFGLAKALEAPGVVSSPEESHSPTLTSPAMTRVGVILGTAAYMAPEQARGQAADRRADIWAFGVVLYEMLTGNQPFAGTTVSDILAGVLRVEVDFAALPDSTPRPVRRLLARCLTKDVSQRLQAIGDARLELRDARDAPDHDATTDGRTRRGKLGDPRLVAGLAVVTVLACLAAVWGWLRPNAPETQVTRLSIALPAGEELVSAPAISRDGRQIAYVSQRGLEASRLYVRSLDAFEARAISGTDNAQRPFFSPDGRAIAFFADSSLKVVELSGGSPRSLAATTEPFGGAWTDDDYILFTKTISSGLMQVPAAGGEVGQLTKPDLAAGEYAHVWPRLIDGGARVLFSTWQSRGAGTALLDRATGERSRLLAYPGGSFAAGHLLIPWGDEVEGDFAALRAAPLGHDASAVRDAFSTVLEGVYGVPFNGDSWYSVAANGTLAYVPGTVADRQLVWVDTEGRMQPASEVRAVYDQLSLSPDGRYAAVKSSWNLWVYDLKGGTRSPLTSEGSSGNAVWARDGKRVFFSSNRSGNWDVWARSADGTGASDHVWERELSQWTCSAAPDGTLLVMEPNPKTACDLWTIPPGGEPRPFLVTDSNDLCGEFSPDGRLVAYVSEQAGRFEIYVTPYPGPGPRVPISRDGGSAVLWSRDGKTLFYRQGSVVMAATLGRGRGIEVVERHRLFSGSFLELWWGTWGGIAPDGRFLMIHRGPRSVPDRINVVLNWTSELERLAGAR